MTGRHARAEPRQHARMRLVRACYGVLLAVVAVSAVTMVVLHGPAFFVFRDAGTGATSSDGGLAENQGPGQPDAPRPVLAARHRPAPRPRVTVFAVRPGPTVTVTVTVTPAPAGSGP